MIAYMRTKMPSYMIPTRLYYDMSVIKKCDEFASILDNNNIKYINLLYEEPFISDASLYRDASHLNTDGAVVMTDTLISVINSVLTNVFVQENK